MLAIISYTGNLYGSLNKVLREQPADSPEYKKYLPFVQTMQKGLAKLRDHKQTVYRGITAPAEVADQHQVGKIITYTAFTSASRLASYVEKSPHFIGLEIKSKSGKYIMPFSAAPSEEEVLLSPGAKFRVTQKIMTGKDSWHIKLEEVVD